MLLWQDEDDEPVGEYYQTQGPLSLNELALVSFRNEKVPKKRGTSRGARAGALAAALGAALGNTFVLAAPWEDPM